MCIISFYKKGPSLYNEFYPKFTLFPGKRDRYIYPLHLNIPYILSSLKTTNVSLYVTLYIIFLPRVQISTAVVVSCATSAVMMHLNRFESVFDYD